ncbi:hypothetical protein NHX12_017655 [Muraenolepis orangiensis]|uniref:CKK domain-containing protein n=1 Tax=Muraenolepis orangiensis TaxID=630683 RepID=A0A9Q0EWY5_9TELE|nr:hypothetical protein NHX12_017655 [Muraenolepis orangiensis]
MVCFGPQVNIVSFVAELLDWFELQKPEFVQPIEPLDLTDLSGLLDCTSPVSGIGSSGSSSFIFKQPYLPISSPVSPESKTWGKKKISRPLSAVTFSIPFGLDSDVDVVMGNPIESFLQSSVSADDLSCAAGVPAMTRVPYSPPEDLSHLVSASLPSQRSSSWGLHSYPHAPPSRNLPTIEEALAATLHGAPAGFFLHSPKGDSLKLSCSAPGRSWMLHRPLRGEPGTGGHRQGRGDRQRKGDRQGREDKRERPARAPDTPHDDVSLLRDGSVDSSNTSDNLLPRNAPGNLRPGGSGNHGSPGSPGNSGSPRMTNFAERRDNRRQSSAFDGGESALSAQTPITPGTPHRPIGARGYRDGSGGREPGSEAWELGARLEEKRKSIEAQKRRIEALFSKHRQRLGKTAFLQLKREQGEGGGGTQLEKQVTFSIETRKLPHNEGEEEKGREGGAVLEDYNGVVQKLSKVLQSLQKDMQKLTEQQQQLMGKPRHMPKCSPKTTPKSTPRGRPTTPPETPPRTPTKTTLRGPSKAWVTPPCLVPSSPGSPSRRPHMANTASTPSKTPMSSSCPPPRTKFHSSTAPHSPKHHPRPSHQHHPRPSDLKFPPLARVLTPPQNVDTLPHLRRVSPSKCQVQTSSSFRIGGPRTPVEAPQPLRPSETASEAGSSGTPTQFSLELENDDGGMLGDLVALPCMLRSGITDGSSSGAPSECSFGSETVSLSAVFSPGGGGRATGRSKASLSSLVGPEGGSDEPTDEGQEFSSDSMSDHTEPARGTEAVSISGEPVDLPEDVDLPEHTASSEPGAEDPRLIEALEPLEHQTGCPPRSGIGFFFEQRRVEEVKKKRRQWNEREPGFSEGRHVSPCPPPPPASASPFLTPPATPVRWGEFTRAEYSLRHQLKVMADLGKALQLKPANLGPAGGKKTRPRARPRSATRALPQLSHSLDNGNMDGDVGPNGTPPAPEYTGPKLFKEPSFKSNKFIIHNALSRCCLAGKVNETQKKKMVEEMDKSPANHFLILFRDASCQFRGVYTVNPDTQELVRLAGVGPRTIGSTQVECIYKYSSDRKLFSAIPSKTLGMSVDAFTIPGPLWQAAGAAPGGGRRASVTKKAALAK